MLLVLRVVRERVAQEPRERARREAVRCRRVVAGAEAVVDGPVGVHLRVHLHHDVDPARLSRGAPDGVPAERRIRTIVVAENVSSLET